MSEEKTEPAQAAFEVAQLRMSEKNRLKWAHVHELTRQHWRDEAQAAIDAYLLNIGIEAGADYEHPGVLLDAHREARRAWATADSLRAALDAATRDHWDVGLPGEQAKANATRAENGLGAL